MRTSVACRRPGCAPRPRLGPAPAHAGSAWFGWASSGCATCSRAGGSGVASGSPPSPGRSRRPGSRSPSTARKHEPCRIPTLVRGRGRGPAAPAHLTAREDSMGKDSVRPSARALTLVALAATGLVAPGIGAASAADVGRLVRITSGDPLAGCTADNARQQVKAGSVLYPATEIEPWVAADPSHPGRLIAGWQQDRWNDGGAPGLLAGVSDDGGASWKTVRSGRVAKCEGGPWTRESDPWVDIGPSGIAYFIHLPFENNLPNGGSGSNAVSVTRSTNGSRSWEAPVTLVRETDPQATTDKESVTADPSNPSYAYAVWDLYIDYTVPPQAAVAGTRQHDVVAQTRERLRQLHAAGQAAEAPSKLMLKGPVYFSRTTDAGRTWEKARQIYDPGPNAQTIGNIVEVLPNGTVVDFFDETDAKGVLRIKLLRSFDHGRTFEKKPMLVSVQVNGAFIGTVTPDKQELVRDANILFDVAVDPKSGTLYAVWQDTRFEAPVQAVMFAQSN